MSSNIPGDASFLFPSGMSGGNPSLIVTATSSGAAQTVHTAASGTDDVDYLTIWAANIDGTTDGEITLEIGAVSYGPFLVPAFAAPFKLLDGVPLHNSVAVDAWADAGSVVALTGKVIRIVEGTA